MSKTTGNEFGFGNRPNAISAPERNSKHGHVVAEVGVFQRGSGARDYWKVIQRIRTDDGRVEVRPGYYAGRDDDWDWAQDPVLLPADVYNELHARAVTEGILTE